MIKKIMIIGAGTMGRGIAQLFSQKGFDATLYDIDEKQIKKSVEKINHSLDREVEQGRISLKEKEETLKRINTTTQLERAKEVDFIIESAPENIEIKKGILNFLDKICPSNIIFASNTSSLSITEIAGAVTRKDRIIGMHFFNPPAKMELIEIVCGEKTSEQTFQIVKELGEASGKKIVRVKDSPGFIVNRLLIPMINEACFLLQEKVARPEEIDLAMQSGARHPSGPLALADLIGLDVCLSIMETFYEKFQDSKYKPCLLLEEMVKNGKRGKKTGEGFFKY